MRLQIGVPIQALDLAEAVRGDQGTFLCQQGGQNFLLVSAEGHSIKYGPSPIGRKYQESGENFSLTPEPWTVTKISNDDVSSNFQNPGSRTAAGSRS